MRCLQLPPRRSARRSARPYGYVVFLLTALGLLVVPAVSAAGGFTERVASARWDARFRCPDGSTAADGRLIVETDNFIDAGTTPDPNPPLRVGFTGQCPDGTFSWGFPSRRRRSSTRASRTVTVSGTFTDVQDNGGGTHTVFVDARWKGSEGSRPRSTGQARRAGSARRPRRRRSSSTAARSSTATPISRSPRRSCASTGRGSKRRQDTSKLIEEGAMGARPPATRVLARVFAVSAPAGAR